jgi:hypothetical protein
LLSLIVADDAKENEEPSKPFSQILDFFSSIHLCNFATILGSPK